MLKPISLGLRVLQFLMALTILALAVDLIRKQVIGSAPVTTRYTTFTGGFGMIVCGVTIASFFLSFLPGVVAMGLDALAGLLFLGGGIALAHALRNVDNCTNGDNMLLNPLLNRGTVEVGRTTHYGIVEEGDADNPTRLYFRLRGSCQRAQAAEILQFLSFGVLTALAVAGFWMMRQGGGGGTRRGAYVA
ncbi:hypothetical protein VTJ04DRAFT_5658 [Mycothermus thermophilus]|uniref:uncharacterized protein n=1 Tax=Humicola insolens TaxID=85995 RepID=UPI0037431A2F